MEWQTFVALIFVAMSATYVANRSWQAAKVWSHNDPNNSRCGSCHGCSHNPTKGDPPIVTLQRPIRKSP